MSTRWYPIYKRGNPQLRVFMTNFWMRLVRNEQKPTPPPNVVTFHCSMEMTHHDIKNYLTKIYNIPIVDVRTEVRLGEFYQVPIKKYVNKKNDYRVAIVTMVRKLFAPFFSFIWFWLIPFKDYFNGFLFNFDFTAKRYDIRISGYFWCREERFGCK